MIGKASAIAGSTLLLMGICVWAVQQYRDRDSAVAPLATGDVVPTPDSGTVSTDSRSTAPSMPVIRIGSAALHAKLQPLLNRGTDMSVASAGFQSAEQFGAVAHAARNTGVPFMVLKDRVLNERQSLARAIHGLAPDVNAQLEAARALAEARSDLAALAL